MGRLVKSGQPCPLCPSSDAAAQYDVDSGPDGFCFSCHQSFNWDSPENSPRTAQDQRTDLAVGSSGVTPKVPVQGDLDALLAIQCSAWPDRGLFLTTIGHYGAKELSGKRYYPVYRADKLVGYKTRGLPKSFGAPMGDIKGAIQFYGQHKWPAGGEATRICVITCGEEDAMAAYQMTQETTKNRQPYCCVSTVHGCGSLVRAVKDNLGWLETFEKVIFAVDQEEGDLDKALEAAALLSPKKAAIAKFSENDANAMLQAGKQQEFYKALWTAKSYTPAGIVAGSDTWELIDEFISDSVFQFPEIWGLNDLLPIIRPDDLLLVAAGTGVGKSTMLKELEYHLFNSTDHSIGVIHLEECLENTAVGLLGMELGLKLDVLRKNQVDRDELKAAWDKLFGKDRFYFERAFGALEEMDIVTKIRYLVKGCDCKIIIIDHLHALASEFGDDLNKHLHKLMYRLKGLTQELNCLIIIAAHVRKRSDGSKSYEEGAIPNLDSILGSGSAKQVADTVLAISKDSSQDPGITQYHVLKNRHYGRVGSGNRLTYSYESGRIELFQNEGVM